MFFWKLIRNLHYKQLSSLLSWFIKHPLYMFSFIEATYITLKISQKRFPNIHGKHNKANAFRHALWNVYIAKKCKRFSKSTEAILQWTKKITDWHEEFSPNAPLAKAMDLHNNKKGRDYFTYLIEKQPQEIINFILSQLENAIKVIEISAIHNIDVLVYLED